MLLRKKTKHQFKTSIPTQLHTKPKRRARKAHNCATPRPAEKQQTIRAVGDTGATDLLVRESEQHKITGYRPVGGHEMELPNGQVITSTGTGRLQLPANVELTANIYPDDVLKHNLAPIAPLCNQGCTAVFTSTEATVTRGDTVVLQGAKEPTEMLWHFQIPTSPTPVNSCGQANLVTNNQLDAERVRSVDGSNIWRTSHVDVSQGRKERVPEHVPTHHTQDDFGQSTGCNGNGHGTSGSHEAGTTHHKSSTNSMCPSARRLRR